MPVTSANLNHAAKRMHTSSYQTTTLSHNPTDQSSQSPLSWDWCTPRLICAQEMVPLRNALNKMGWIQPRSPIQVDNSTAVGYVNNTIIARCVESLEMQLNWLKCRESKDQFQIFWDKGSHNLADYHTKHHPPETHIAHRHSHAGWIMQPHPTQANLRVFPIPKKLPKIAKTRSWKTAPAPKNCYDQKLKKNPTTNPPKNCQNC